MDTPRASNVGSRLRAALVVAIALSVGATAGARDGQRELSAALRRGPGVSNHPVGVVPSARMRVPEGWPLDADGSITCITCHTAVPSLIGRPHPRLRDFDESTSEPTEFCMRCHALGDEPSAATMHWLALGRAHVMDEQKREVRSCSAGRGLDRQTKECLGCHDGVSARESRNPTPWNRGRGYTGVKQREHPVGVRYPSRPRKGRGVPFRPASLLPKHVPLPEGKVGCVSCHDLYADSERLLTVPISGSRLCLTCHDLK